MKDRQLITDHQDKEVVVMQDLLPVRLKAIRDHHLLVEIVEVIQGVAEVILDRVEVTVGHQEVHQGVQVHIVEADQLRVQVVVEDRGDLFPSFF